MKNRTMSFAGLCVASLFMFTAQASAQPLGGDTEWATIGAVGNKAYDLQGPVFDPTTQGRGAVNYEYRIATHEVTTGQWMEFVNTFNGIREDGSEFLRPHVWGAQRDFSYAGQGIRFELNQDFGTTAARIPVGGITWRDSARFVNWLHNGKRSDAASMATGAYDTSTFGFEDDGRRFTDQAAHSTGAKFWIPTFDEWFKAVHYDPSKLNENGSNGGWWFGPHGSHNAPLIGLPEDGGETSGGLAMSTQEAIAVGSYGITSPWGLYDVSGGVSEYTESIMQRLFETNVERMLDGSSGASGPRSAEAIDYAALVGGERPFSGGIWTGLRIASVVPAPGASTVICISLVFVGGRRRSI